MRASSDNSHSDHEEALARQKEMYEAKSLQHAAVYGQPPGGLLGGTVPTFYGYNYVSPMHVEMQPFAPTPTYAPIPIDGAASGAAGAGVAGTASPGVVVEPIAPATVTGGSTVTGTSS